MALRDALKVELIPYELTDRANSVCRTIEKRKNMQMMNGILKNRTLFF